MAFLRKYFDFKIKASSILESVLALSIISICMYIAILVVSAVFAKRTAAKFYDTQHKMNELFYLAQLRGDSLMGEGLDENLTISEEIINAGLKRVMIECKDSIGVRHEKSFYIQMP